MATTIMVGNGHNSPFKPDTSSFFIIDDLCYSISVTALGAILGMGLNYILNIIII